MSWVKVELTGQAAVGKWVAVPPHQPFPPRPSHAHTHTHTWKAEVWLCLQLARLYSWVNSCLLLCESLPWVIWVSVVMRGGMLWWTIISWEPVWMWHVLFSSCFVLGLIYVHLLHFAPHLPPHLRSGLANSSGMNSSDSQSNRIN